MFQSVHAFTVAAALLSPVWGAGGERPTHRLLEVGAEGAPPAPAIDGVLDDPAWLAAQPIGPLSQVIPVAGADPSERTEVRLCFDADHVYVGLICFDDDPAAIRATQMQRDANLDPDDRVELLFDPFLDRRNGFWFQIGAAGSRGDALISNNGSTFNKQWDGIWYGEARITERGWEAELAIPTKTLNFDPAGTAWGFNVRRLIRRRNEEARWASPEPRIGFFSLANAGTLEGLRGLRQGIGLDFAPFAVTDYTRDRDDHDDTLTGDVGFDAFWRLTPSTKLSVSVNTDFAETEVDSRRVNLTRFPLFFPEKRGFFLEDSGVYEFGETFGRGGRDVIPFFSRRIGLDDSGGEVPLLGAVKLTGRTDSYSFGLTDVQTGDLHDLDAQNLFAGRFVKNLGEQSNLGVVWTHGDPEGEVRADTYGLDYTYRSNDFAGEGNFEVSSWVLRSDNEGTDDDDLAFAARVAYPNDLIDTSLTATVIEDGFDPRLGFVRRGGTKQYEWRFRYAPRINRAIRRLFFSFDPSLVTDTANRTRTVSLPITPLSIEMDSGDEFSVSITPQREVLSDDFDITSSVTIPEATYDFTRYRARLETSDMRDVSAELSFTTGDFFGGDRDEFEVELSWRASRHALFDLEYEWNDVELPDGDFTVNVARLRATLLANPWVSWSNFVQWDDLSDQVGLNSRLWWIFEPGNEAFLVLNQGWDVDDGTSGLDTHVALKVGYTFRF